MWKDPIVEEIHTIRAQLLAHFEGDLHKYCEFVRTQPLEILLTEVAAATLPALTSPSPEQAGTHA